MWGWRVITAKWRGVCGKPAQKKRQVNMMQGHAKMAYTIEQLHMTITSPSPRKNYHIKVNENEIILLYADR